MFLLWNVFFYCSTKSNSSILLAAAAAVSSSSIEFKRLNFNKRTLIITKSLWTNNNDDCGIGQRLCVHSGIMTNRVQKLKMDSASFWRYWIGLTFLLFIFFFIWSITIVSNKHFELLFVCFALANYVLTRFVKVHLPLLNWITSKMSFH